MGAPFECARRAFRLPFHMMGQYTQLKKTKKNHDLFFRCRMAVRRVDFGDNQLRVAEQTYLDDHAGESRSKMPSVSG